MKNKTNEIEANTEESKTRINNSDEIKTASETDANSDSFSENLSSSSLQGELAIARENLCDIIRLKCPAAASDFVVMSLTPIIKSLSVSDCENMTKIIEKKGLKGALLMGKKMKKKIQKEGGDLSDGKVDR